MSLWVSHDGTAAAKGLERFGMLSESLSSSKSNVKKQKGKSLWDEDGEGDNADANISVVLKEDILFDSSNKLNMEKDDTARAAEISTSKSRWFGFGSKKKVTDNTLDKELNTQMEQKGVCALAPSSDFIDYKCEYEKYHGLYHEALLKISVLEQNIKNLESDLKHIENQQYSDQPLTSEKGNITPMVEKENEWEKLANEEKIRKAKIQAKKLADARRKGSKRITSSRSSTTAAKAEIVEEFVDTELVVPSKAKIKPTVPESLWDEDEDQSALASTQLTDVNKLENKLQWDSSDDDGWFSDDNEITIAPTDSELFETVVSQEQVLFSSIDSNLEAAIDRNIKEWATAGKHIINLLQTVRVVYHGFVAELGDEWIIGYSNGTLTPSHVRRAYLSTVRYCHPDKQNATATVLIKLQAQKVFSVLSEAYNVYKDQQNS